MQIRFRITLVRNKFKRNSFRNQAIDNVNLRVLKSFKLGENKRLQFSTEMFNLFNFSNVVIAGGNLQYGPGINADGTTAAARATFLRLKYPNGAFDTTNTQIGYPFQAQFGLRFFF